MMLTTLKIASFSVIKLQGEIEWDKKGKGRLSRLSHKDGGQSRKNHPKFGYLT